MKRQDQEKLRSHRRLTKTAVKASIVLLVDDNSSKSINRIVSSRRQQ
ncbi:hypothetical protein [Siminovitchia sp. FSL W7-1587]